LTPASVRVEAPAFSSAPVPPMTPEKVLSAVWLTVSVLAPSVTVPAPVSGPTV
jgi:hypothetical protein